MPEEKLKKLQEILTEKKIAKDKSPLTKIEFFRIVKKLIELIKNTRLKNDKELKDLEKSVSDAFQTIKLKRGKRGPKGFRGEKGKQGKQGSTGKEGKQGSTGKEGDRGRDGKDGKDADENKVSIIASERAIEHIQPMFPKPETSVSIANKLEKLKDDEKLEIGTIKGLEDRLKGLESRPSRPTGAGVGKLALEARIVDDETPSGTIDGSNKDFTLANTPNPSTSLKVYLNGMKMKSGGEDYSLSGRTITFNTAPLSGSNILVDYRT